MDVCVYVGGTVHALFKIRVIGPVSFTLDTGACSVVGDQEGGKMKASHLGDAMRSAGMNPTNAEARFGSKRQKELQGKG